LNEPAESIGQQTLRDWLTAGLSLPEVRNLNVESDASYLVNNMIAKYTLAAPFYEISNGALHELQKLQVDLSERHTRGKFYGKDKPFIYEHPVPAGITRNELFRTDLSVESIKQVLQSSGRVTLLLRTEDTQLREAKLNTKMPDGWRFGDNPFARYHEVGIELSGEVLKVKGAIKR